MAGSIIWQCTDSEWRDVFYPAGLLILVAESVMVANCCSIFAVVQFFQASDFCRPAGNRASLRAFTGCYWVNRAVRRSENQIFEDQIVSE
jgi:hypothetical protein